MFNFFKNWFAKEAFYKKKCQEGLKELDQILKNIEQDQAEIEILKRQTQETLKRVEKAMNNLRQNYESNIYSNY
ncbi:hypothetical protein BH20ACI1_BH20ACI1_20540 [soil metagenome]